MDGFLTKAAPGEVKVFASSGRGHNAEEITEMALGKIISISNTAPAPIRDQAVAFREQLRPILIHYFKMAARSDRTTLHNKLKEVGQHEAADLVLRL